MAFQPVSKEIDAAMTGGLHGIAIYDELRDRLGMAYPTFCRYVKTLELESTPAALTRPDRTRPKEGHKGPGHTPAS
ncbi:MAG: hypothetical protein IPK78_03805 [Rhodospirillales bacterium]|nr:hypothetical protein [Rhodospirillales bacterium]